VTVSPTPADPPPRDEWIVVYDADCGLCRTLLALLLRADSHRRLRPVPLHTPEADRLLADLTPEQRDASWHLVAPDGTRTSAGAAGAPVLRLLPGGALPAAVLDLVPEPTERLYRLVAGNRSTLGPLIPGRVRHRATRLVERRTLELRGHAPSAKPDRV
jgi:predicted DCC family thiol-disulfide oxidoreductase YuxK